MNTMPPYQRGKVSSELIVRDEVKNMGIVTKAPSVRQGELGLVTDQEISNFYGSSVTKSYRLKSELVASHLSKIGMGK